MIHECPRISPRQESQISLLKFHTSLWSILGSSLWQMTMTQQPPQPPQHTREKQSFRNQRHRHVVIYWEEQAPALELIDRAIGERVPTRTFSLLSYTWSLLTPTRLTDRRWTINEHEAQSIQSYTLHHNLIIRYMRLSRNTEGRYLTAQGRSTNTPQDTLRYSDYKLTRRAICKMTV